MPMSRRARGEPTQARFTALLLLFLSAALLALRADASLPRGGAAPERDVAVVASLGEAAPTLDESPSREAARFPVFAGDELALAPRAGELRLDLHRGLDLLAVAPLLGLPDDSPETRIGGLELLPAFRIGGEAKLSLWTRQPCGAFECDLASGEPLDPLGLSWTTFSKGVAEGVANLALGLLQMGTRASNPAGALDPFQYSVNLTRAGQSALVTSLRDPVAELKSLDVVHPVGETLGRFGGNAAMTVAGWFDPDAPQEYLDELHAEVGRDTPGAVLALAPLPKLLRAARGKSAVRLEGEGATAADDSLAAAGTTDPGLPALPDGYHYRQVGGKTQVVRNPGRAADLPALHLEGGTLELGPNPSVARSAATRSAFLRQLDRSLYPRWMTPYLERGEVPPGFTVHHKKALFDGGTDTIDNMVLQRLDLHTLRHRYYRPGGRFPTLNPR